MTTRILSHLAGALVALALGAALPLLGAVLAAALSCPPGPMQLSAILLAAVTLRPGPTAPAPPAADAVIDHDEAMLWGLLLNREVGV